MGRKKVNVANIGNLSNDNFYKVKKLCAKAEKLSILINSLNDYWDFLLNSGEDLKKISEVRDYYLNESSEIHWEIEKKFKSTK